MVLGDNTVNKSKPLVGIVMGSASDKSVMEEAAILLTKFGISWEMKVSSAHRTPERTMTYAKKAVARGLEVIIAGAGWAAHLAGAIAAQTLIPVIGVPIDSSPLHGMDALLSTVQMPLGVPVATMAVGKGGARNAAILAAQILGLKYPEIRNRVLAYRKELAKECEERDKEVLTT